MSETTLHPQNAAPAKSIITPRQNMTEYQALRQLGFIRGFDFVMLSLLIGHLVFFGFWKFFANPSTNSLLLGAVQCLIILHVWTISLIYRCMHNVLLTRSDINLMPEEAARLVVAYHTGIAPQPRAR
jgi:hypothetical protein